MVGKMDKTQTKMSEYIWQSPLKEHYFLSYSELFRFSKELISRHPPSTCSVSGKVSHVLKLAIF